MTVTSPTARNDYVGAGSTGPFVYGFRIYQASDLQVSTQDTSGNVTTLTLNQYSVAGVGTRTGGTITLTTALATGWLLTILRVRLETQLINYRNQGASFPANIEDGFDQLVMLVQQQQDAINRSFKTPVTLSPSVINTTISAFLPAYYLRVNNAGTGIEGVTQVVAAQNFLQSGIGAVMRSANSKMAERISVTDFGAQPVGGFDNSPAFTKALTYASGGGGTVVDASMLTGSVELHSTVTIPGGVTVLLGAATYKFTATTGNAFIMAPTSGLLGVDEKTSLIWAAGNDDAILCDPTLSPGAGKFRLKDFGIVDQCSGRTQGHGIHLRGVVSGVIADCQNIEISPSAASSNVAFLDGFHTAYCWLSTFRDCHVSTAGRDGFSLEQSGTSVKIVGCYMQNPVRYGFHLHGRLSYSTLEKCAVDFSGDDAYHIGNELAPNDNITMTSCGCELVSGNGVMATDMRGLSLVTCDLEGNVVTGKAAVKLLGCRDVVIVGGYWIAWAEQNVYVDTSPTPITPARVVLIATQMQNGHNGVYDPQNVVTTIATGADSSSGLSGTNRMQSPLSVPAVILPGATLPGSPTAGEIVFDGTHFQGWNGSAWKQLDN